MSSRKFVSSCLNWASSLKTVCHFSRMVQTYRHLHKRSTWKQWNKASMHKCDESWQIWCYVCMFAHDWQLNLMEFLVILIHLHKDPFNPTISKYHKCVIWVSKESVLLLLLLKSQCCIWNQSYCHGASKIWGVIPFACLADYCPYNIFIQLQLCLKHILI